VQFHESYENLQPIGPAYDLLEWQAKLQTELGLLKVQSNREIAALRGKLAEARELLIHAMPDWAGEWHKTKKIQDWWARQMAWLAANREV
jgi:hypothetical protein